MAWWLKNDLRMIQNNLRDIDAGMDVEAWFREIEKSHCNCVMVGAGGIGYVISNSLQGYDYGTAGVAILLVFLVAYMIERVFVRIKRKFN